MCGRYEMFINPENREMMKIVKDIENKYGVKNNMKTGEIFPTNTVPILAFNNNDNIIEPDLYTWGFPSFRNKSVIINARSETALEKSMFKKSLLERRCVVPSTGFYEWSHDTKKEKFKFNIDGLDDLYMAGIWNEFKGEKRFVILTTSANNSIKDIHDRMPVILRYEQINSWIDDLDAATDIINGEHPELIKSVAV
jgi:putative SOS response-associated peptidase YedK